MNITITLIIVIITSIISYQAFNNGNLRNNLIHHPYTEAKDKEWFRMLTSGFIHNDMMHLLINMYVLYTFGEIVERAFGELYGSFGRIVYILFYLICIVVASLPSFLKHKNNPSYKALGASGAVSGVLLIFVLLYPMEKLTFIFFPFLPIPAFVIGIGYLVYSTWASKKKMDNVGHDAHLFGGLFGILFIAITAPSVLSSFVRQLTQLF